MAAQHAHLVGAAAHRLDDLVAGVVEQVDVVAQTTGHAVGTRTTVERVVAVAAVESVGAQPTGQVVGTRVATEVVVEGRAHQALDAGQRVRTCAAGDLDGGHRQADSDGAGGVDVAGGVVARAAAEHVVAGTGEEHVVQAVAVGIGRAGGEEAQVLDVGRHHMAAQHAHLVGAAAHGLDDHVAGVVEGVDVVAQPAHHRIGAAAAVQGVVAVATVQRVGIGAAFEQVGPAQAAEQIAPGIAGQAVGHRVAAAGQVGAAQQQQVLHLVCKGHVDHGLHLVGAAAGALNHGVAGVVHPVDVVAVAALQPVGALAPVEGVVAVQAQQRVAASVADQQVGTDMAAGAGVGHAGQLQLLDLGQVFQRPRHAAQHPIHATGLQLDHLVAHRIDDEAVVAEAAGQQVGPGAAVQLVVAGTTVQAVITAATQQYIGRAVAQQQVVAGITRERGARAAYQAQRLHIGRQAEVDAGLHRVVAAVDVFDHHVGQVVDEVQVVSAATHQAVGAAAAGQGVLAIAAQQRIVLGAAAQVIAPGPAGDLVGTGPAVDPGQGSQVGQRRQVDAIIARRAQQAGAVAGPALDAGRAGREAAQRQRAGHAHQQPVAQRLAVGTADELGGAGVGHRQFEGVVAGAAQQRVGATAAV